MKYHFTIDEWAENAVGRHFTIPTYSKNELSCVEGHEDVSFDCRKGYRRRDIQVSPLPMTITPDPPSVVA